MEVLIQPPSQGSPVQHHHMIPELATYTAHPTLGNSVLPRTAICGPNGLPSHCLHRGDDLTTELCVRSKSRKRCGGSSHSQAWCNCNPSQSAWGWRVPLWWTLRRRSWAKDEEAIQNAEGQRGHGAIIHRRNRFPMIPQERQPALRGVLRFRRPSYPT